MGWKSTGRPIVRQQRGRWVVRVDGLDTETGQHRPRQLGTFPSRRSAEAAAREASADGRAGAERGTVGWLVQRWVKSRTDVGQMARDQYAWASDHIAAGLGAIRLDRLDRDDVAQWLNGLGTSGTLSRRSIQICRTVLRAALADAVEERIIARSPAARVGMPKQVARPGRQRTVEAWDHEQVARFLTVVSEHRWGAPLRLSVLYGLRRSELLALKWDDLDTTIGSIRIDEALVPVGGGVVWTDGKSARSRRVIALDANTLAELARHRAAQLEERLLAGGEWQDYDLIVATRQGRPVLPSNFDHSLAVLVRKSELPRLTSHGLRHTAATHMVRNASDVGELRAAADILGHSPDMLMRVYAHTLPESVRSVTEKIGRRGVLESG